MNNPLLASFAGIAVLLVAAPFSRGQVSSSNLTLVGTNVVNSSAIASTTVGGLTFTNQGLVGVGRIAAAATDAWGETLGSVSGLQVTGWTNQGGGAYSGTFNVLPDRGYNGTTFSNYAARIQAVDFTFTPYTGVATSGVAQNQFALTYNAANSVKFSYDSDPGAGVTLRTTTGLVPDTSTAFAGASVPYVTVSNGAGTNTTTGMTTAINKIAMDAEALVLKADGSGWIGDEYGANVYHFNSSKVIDGVLGKPAASVPTLSGSANYSSEVTPNTGRRGNQGMEGLSVSPDGTKLFGLMQSALVQDTGTGNQGRFNARLMVWDVSSNTAPTAVSAEYVLQLPIGNDTGVGAANRTFAQSEIVVLDSTHILVLSREGNGKGTSTTSAPVYKSILLVDLAAATNIAGTGFDATTGDITPSGSTLSPGITAVTWSEAINLLNTFQLGKFDLNVNSGINANANSLSEKWEGLSLVPTGTLNEYFLFVANDNDFISGATIMNGFNDTLNAPIDVVTANGLPVANDTMFLAYRVTIASAIPEPSSYAAIAGLALLGFAATRRRRVR